MSWEKPLGLILPGGGSLGAWQAGCLKRLVEAGLEFDHVLGFSIGALNGAAYCAGELSTLLKRWRSIDGGALLFAPKWKPLSLFSDQPLRKAIGEIVPQERAKLTWRCRLTVMSLCVDDTLPIFAEFHPQGRGSWDHPLSEHLVASCAIPLVFPPIRMSLGGRSLTLVDGGVPGRAPLSLEIFMECRGVLVLEMFRLEEFQRLRWNPRAYYEGKMRRNVYEMISQGLDSLKNLAQPPRLYRFQPSRILEFSMLSFKNRHCAPSLELGYADAERLLKDPERYLVA